MADYPSPANPPQYNPLPPPPPARSGDGCWKWGGLGCGLGCLSLGIMFAAAVFILIPQLRPLISECMKFESDTTLIQDQMRSTLRAIERYREARGAFPPNLDALVPTYVRDQKLLRYSQNPQGPVFKYTKPSDSDDAASVILEYALTFRLIDNRTIPIPMRLSRDGAFSAVAVPEQCRNLIRRPD